MSGKQRRRNQAEEAKELSKWAKMTKPGEDWTKVCLFLIFGLDFGLKLFCRMKFWMLYMF